MERLFLECFVRAALLVGATAIVLYAMRVKTATAKHSVWAGVVALSFPTPSLLMRISPALPARPSSVTVQSTNVRYSAPSFEGCVNPLTVNAFALAWALVFQFFVLS